MTTTAVETRTARRPNRKRTGPKRVLLHAFLILKVLLWMSPILWAFFLKDMPSGLVLYWFFSNLLTIVQQLVMNRLVKEDPAPPSGGGAKALKQARA